MAVHIVNYLIVHSVHQFPSAYVISDLIHCFQSIQNQRAYHIRNVPDLIQPSSFNLGDGSPSVLS
jgi:hypothetical protein